MPQFPLYPKPTNNQAHLCHIPLVPVTEALTVEVAGGHTLPFEGYIVVDFNVAFSNTTFTALFLVVPETSYNARVPVLPGTNILSMMTMTGHDSRIFMSGAWTMAITLMQEQEKWLQEHSGLMGLGKMEKIALQPNSQTVVNCLVASQCHYAGTVIADATANSELPESVHVEPLLVYMSPFSQQSVPVHLCNTSNQTVIVQPDLICCEVQMVQVADSPKDANRVSAGPEFDLDGDDIPISAEQKATALNFLRSWSGVFSKDDLDIGYTNAVLSKNSSSIAGRGKTSLEAVA